MYNMYLCVCILYIGYIMKFYGWNNTNSKQNKSSKIYLTNIDISTSNILNQVTQLYLAEFIKPNVIMIIII